MLLRLAMAGEDESYLLAASLYIHLNPVKATIVVDPVEYRWSSIGLYCDENALKSFVDPSLILGLLSKQKNGRIDNYHLLLKRGREVETGWVLEQEDAIERFGSKLEAIFPALFKRIKQRKKIVNPLSIDLLDLETLEKNLPAIASRSGEAGGN